MMSMFDIYEIFWDEILINVMVLESSLKVYLVKFLVSFTF